MKDNQNRRSFLRSAGSVGVLALMGLGLLGCRHSLSSPGDSPATPPPTQSSDRHHVVNMVGASGQFVFEPDRLVIQPGDTVEFVVESSGHTATAYSPELRGTSPLRIPDGAPAWDTGFLTSAGQSYEHTFEIEGVHNYYCIPHEGSGMVGMIVVGRALDGPGLTPPEESLPLAARNKLAELIDWARSL